MSELFTIGYERATVLGLLEALTAAQVELLVDVRAVASSRRPGFAKSKLAANLQGVEIGYLHLKCLGTPAEGRAAARSGQHGVMAAIFKEHLKSAAAQDELEALADLIRNKRRICLLCLEADHRHCHRSLVADALAELLPLTITHLEPIPSTA